MRAQHTLTVPRWLLATALALTMGGVPLVGCSAGGGETTDDAAATEQADDTDTGEKDEAAKDAVAEDDGAVWVIKRQTTTITMGDESYAMYDEYERDERGNVLKITEGDVPAEDNEADEALTYGEEYEIDEDGYVTASSVVDGSEEMREEFELQKDKMGNLVLRSSKDGGYKVEQKFDDNGRLLTRTVTSSYVDYDEEDDMEVHEYKSVVTYGPDGYITKVSITQDDTRTEGEYEYTYNKAGVATATVYHEWELDEDGNKIEESVREATSKAKIDKNGNVVHSETNEGDATTVTEYEWVKVENPSKSTQAEAAQRFV